MRFDEPKKDYPVYISNTFNHFKNEGIFERWYFTGDHRMLDVLEEQKRFAVEYTGADRAGSQPRGPGNQMMMLAKFYEHTLDDVFKERCATVFNKNNKREVTNKKSGKVNFQQGVQLEGARRYYEISGDPAVIDYMKFHFESFKRTGTRQINAAQGFGFL